ncbi:MAG: serine/threonine-protein kinase [Candidatus Promineifilaceae bacterium]
MTNLIGKRLDHFRVDMLLGEGGMGSVYRAYDMNLARPVALKVMHPHLTRQPEFQQRFLQEAQASARLSHPNIVDIYHFGRREDLLYMAIEYIEGDSLGAYIGHLYRNKQFIRLDETLDLLAQVADGLDYAHRQGVVHRDVKPDNILIKVEEHPTEEGASVLRAVVTDFGLAKLREGGIQTVTGTLMGTLAYMSPEQCVGEELDGRSDIYSLGIVLYQLSTGRLPFNIKSPTDAIMKHMQEDPPPPRELRPGLPVEVEAVIARALAKKPDGRYKTAGQMAAALRRSAAFVSGPVTPFENAETVVSIATVVRPVSDLRPTLPEEAVSQENLLPSVDKMPTKPPPPPRQPPAYRGEMPPPPQPVRKKRSLSSAIVLGIGAFLCLGLIVVGGYLLYPALFGQETATPTVPIIAAPPTLSETPFPEDTETAAPEATATERTAVTETPTEPATPGPAVSDIYFCLEPCLADGSNAVTAAPPGITQIFVRWNYENFPVGGSYVRRWTNNGEEWVRYQCIWPGPTSGIDEVPLSEPEGLRSGIWEVSILLNDEVVAQQRLTVTGNWTFWFPAGVFNTCYGRR